MVVAVYLEAEDWEDMKRLKKVARSDYVASAVRHFRMQYNRPTFLIRWAAGEHHGHQVLQLRVVPSEIQAGPGGHTAGPRTVPG